MMRSVVCYGHEDSTADDWRNTSVYAEESVLACRRILQATLQKDDDWALALVFCCQKCAAKSRYKLYCAKWDVEEDRVETAVSE